MLLQILAIVCPVFASVLAGWGYGRRHQPDLVAANRMNMEVFIPALVLGALADGQFDLRAQALPALAMAGMVLGSGLLAWPLARLFRVAPLTLIPPMMFNNCGNLGLPLTVLAFGPRMLPTALVLFLTSNLLHFSLGAWLLDRRQHPWSLWRIPVVTASLAGLGCNLLRLPLWTPLQTGIHMLGEISVPLMLFSLGVKVAEAPLAQLRLGLLAGLLRPLLGVSLMLAGTRLLGLQGAAAGICLLFGALPPAVLNYMFADRYRQHPDQVASIVVVGNLLTVVAIPLVLAFVLGSGNFH